MPVAAGQRVRQPRAQHQQAVGPRKPRGQARVHPDAQVAGIDRIVVVDPVLPAERGRDRDPAGARIVGDGAAASALHCGPPTTISGRAAAASAASMASRSACATVCRGVAVGAMSGTSASADSTSSGSARTTGPGRPDWATWNARDDVFGQPLGLVHLGRPLGERREHRAEIHLLERLAVAVAARDLAHEEDHRRRILPRHVHPGRGVGGPRPPGDEGDARPPGQLGRRLGHHRRRPLVSGRHHLDLVVVQPVERGQKALARHLEHAVHPVRRQVIGQDPPTVPHDTRTPGRRDTALGRVGRNRCIAAPRICRRLTGPDMVGTSHRRRKDVA